MVDRALKGMKDRTSGGYLQLVSMIGQILF